MIVYLVAATRDAGLAEAKRRGWFVIAANRFATPAKHDVRLVTRISDLLPQPGVTLMIKSGDYDEGPAEGDVVNRTAWLGRDDIGGQRAEFDAFVASGLGRWVEDEAEIPINRGVQYGSENGSGAEQQF